MLRSLLNSVVMFLAEVIRAFDEATRLMIAVLWAAFGQCACCYAPTRKGNS
ncbi:MAG: hypothetical protein HY287_00250 [Planctomycetes bacterium]|nr:hypothetical protein [Planctomycetota bacterium]